MTRLNNMMCTRDLWYGTKYSLEVETDDVKVVNYLAKKADVNLLFPDEQEEENTLPEIKDVIFHDPATIIIWSDGTKTVVKADARYDDWFDYEMGLAMAICKKAFGNKGNFNEVFKKWIWNNDKVM